MNSLKEKSLNFNKKINFDGGDLTSDAGLFLYKEFNEKIGLSVAIENNLRVKDDAKFRYHTNSDIAIHKIYQNISGYHTDDNADDLINDPAFTAVLEKGALASQPTISRFNNRLAIDNVKQFEKINELLLNNVYSVEMPSEIIFDIDSTNFETYGNQHGSAYNFHYSSTGYHPYINVRWTNRRFN